MYDPRTSYFYKLRKRDAAQLSAEEAREVQRVCELMMEYVGNGRQRKEWSELANEYSAIANPEPSDSEE